MIQHPRMTSRGKQLAVLVAVLVVFFLPKKVDCGYPDGRCGVPGRFRVVCTPYELEPLGLYLVEQVAHRDIGFAYTSGETCR